MSFELQVAIAAGIGFVFSLIGLISALLGGGKTDSTAVGLVLTFLCGFVAYYFYSIAPIVQAVPNI